MKNGEESFRILYQERCTNFILPWVKTNAKELLVSGKKIEALKLIRDYTHYSLKESKELLDDI